MSVNALVLLVGHTTVDDATKRLVLATVAQCETKREAAAQLGICTKTLYNYLKSYAGKPKASPTVTIGKELQR